MVEVLAAMGPLEELRLLLTVLVPDDEPATQTYRVPVTGAAGSGLAETAEHTRERGVQDTRLEHGPAVLIPSTHCM